MTTGRDAARAWFGASEAAQESYVEAIRVTIDRLEAEATEERKAAQDYIQLADRVGRATLSMPPGDLRARMTTLASQLEAIAADEERHHSLLALAAQELSARLAQMGM